MTIARKQIAWAIINLLNGQGPQTAPISVPSNPVYPTVGRKLPDPNDLSGGEFPGLFVIKPDEEYTYDGEGDTMPPTRQLNFLIVVYTDFTNQSNAVPADAIDDLMDGIDAAIAPTGADMMNGNRQTLGGLVYSCVVTGEPKFYPGDGEGKGGFHVPVRVTLASYP